MEADEFAARLLMPRISFAPSTTIPRRQWLPGLMYPNRLIHRLIRLNRLPLLSSRRLSSCTRCGIPAFLPLPDSAGFAGFPCTEELRASGEFTILMKSQWMLSSGSLSVPNATRRFTIRQASTVPSAAPESLTSALISSAVPVMAAPMRIRPMPGFVKCAEKQLTITRRDFSMTVKYTAMVLKQLLEMFKYIQ